MNRATREHQARARRALRRCDVPSWWFPEAKGICDDGCYVHPLWICEVEEGEPREWFVCIRCAARRNLGLSPTGRSTFGLQRRAA